MDKNFVNIDDLVRQRLGGGEERERAGSWLQMKDLLDKEMPQDKPVGIYWKRMMGVVAVGVLLAGLSVGGYEVNSFMRRSVGDVHPAVAEGANADDIAMHDVATATPTADNNSDNHLTANELSDNVSPVAANNNVSLTTAAEKTTINNTSRKHRRTNNTNNNQRNTENTNSNNQQNNTTTIAANSAATTADQSKTATKPAPQTVANTANHNPSATNGNHNNAIVATQKVANTVATTSNKEVVASNSTATTTKGIAKVPTTGGTDNAPSSDRLDKAPITGGLPNTSADKKALLAKLGNNTSTPATGSDNTITSTKADVKGSIAVTKHNKTKGTSSNHNRGSQHSTKLPATGSHNSNAIAANTITTANNNNDAPSTTTPANGVEANNPLNTVSSSAPVVKNSAPKSGAAGINGNTKVGTALNAMAVHSKVDQSVQKTSVKTTIAKAGVVAGNTTANHKQDRGLATVTPKAVAPEKLTAVAPVANATPVITAEEAAAIRNNKIAEENKLLVAARTAQMEQKRNEAKTKLRALNSRLKTINNSGTVAAVNNSANNAVVGTNTSSMPNGNTAGNTTLRNKTIVGKLPLAGKPIATNGNGVTGVMSGRTVAFPTGTPANKTGSAGSSNSNVLSSSAGSAKTMPVAGSKGVEGALKTGGTKMTAAQGNTNAEGNEVGAAKTQTRGKRVIERLTILQQYIRTSPNEGYMNMDTISRETLTQEFGIAEEPSPASGSNARKSGSVLSANSNNAQSAISKLVPAASAMTTTKTVSGSIKEMPSETSVSNSQSLENLSAAFNDIKTKVGAIQFAPGLIAGINGTFFGPANFKGFHFGITGNIIFDPNWNVMVELKYFNRINSDYSLNDDYYNYTPNNNGGYTKELQTNSYSFATLHSLELPVAIRFTAGNFNFYGGGSVSYMFGVNTGAAATPSTTDPVVVSAIGSDNQPKLKASDFDARFGVGYLFGASFQAGPNVSFDFRSVQNVWDNASSTGGKTISNELYRSPSFQISFGYRLGGNKENK